MLLSMFKPMVPDLLLQRVDVPRLFSNCPNCLGCCLNSSVLLAMKSDLACFFLILNLIPKINEFSVPTGVFCLSEF